ncbi:hypothetical protein EHN06_07605 [Marinobacter sp. NP-4(2019)]|nr:hypothetical protein EHN06_07605 [Marinobacter sp. NP-4(2019)]
MTLSRRDLLIASGSALVAIKCPVLASSRNEVLIAMRGTARGERVWFDPLGVAVSPGTTLRFINLDPTNSHTVTAYHPQLFGRELRIPKSAAPFDSGYLLPRGRFELTLVVPGVYDFYCLPHEAAAMVGRIVVGKPGDDGWDDTAIKAGGVTEKAEDILPSVRDILTEGRVNVRGQT